MTRPSGMTVIETLVAVTLFLVAVVSLVGVYPASVRAARQAHGHLVATHLAEREIELSRAQEYGGVEPREGQYTLEVESNGAKVPVEYTTRVTVQEVRDGLKRVQVTVLWNGLDRLNRQLQMETYVARLSP